MCGCVYSPCSAQSWTGEPRAVPSSALLQVRALASHAALPEVPLRVVVRRKVRTRHTLELGDIGNGVPRGRGQEGLSLSLSFFLTVGCNGKLSINASCVQQSPGGSPEVPEDEKAQQAPCHGTLALRGIWWRSKSWHLWVPCLSSAELARRSKR